MFIVRMGFVIVRMNTTVLHQTLLISSVSFSPVRSCYGISFVCFINFKVIYIVLSNMNCYLMVFLLESKVLNPSWNDSALHAKFCIVLFHHLMIVCFYSYCIASHAVLLHGLPVLCKSTWPFSYLPSTVVTLTHNIWSWQVLIRQWRRPALLEGAGGLKCYHLFS